MGKSVLLCHHGGPGFAANTSYVLPPYGGMWGTNTLGNEDNHTGWFRSNGTSSLITATVVTNGTSGASTFKIRINKADGEQSVSIPAGGTGCYQDSVNVDNVPDGTQVGMYLTVGPGGSCVMSGYSSQFEVDSGEGDVVDSYAWTNATSIGTSTTNYYHGYNGNFNATTTEANVQMYIDSIGTVSDLAVKVISNGRNGISEIYFRLDGADGSNALSIGTGVTGWVHDSSNTDTIGAGAHLINYRYYLNGTAGSINLFGVTSKFRSTNRKYPVGGLIWPPPGNLSTTSLYTNFMGYLPSSNPNSGILRLPCAVTASYWRVRGSVNSTTGTANYYIWESSSASDTSLVVDMVGGGTSWVSDTSNTHKFSAGDGFAYHWEGTDSGTFTPAVYSLTFTANEEPAATGTNIQINVGDVWKTVSAVKINIGDSWKDVTSIKQNIGDSWKTVF